MFNFFYLQKKLRLGIVNIKFIKKNGELRVMNATLRPDFIKKLTGETVYEQDFFYKKTERKNLTFLRILDVDLMEWRCFNPIKILEVDGIKVF